MPAQFPCLLAVLSPSCPPLALPSLSRSVQGHPRVPSLLPGLCLGLADRKGEIWGLQDGKGRGSWDISMAAASPPLLTPTPPLLPIPHSGRAAGPPGSLHFLRLQLSCAGQWSCGFPPLGPRVSQCIPLIFYPAMSLYVVPSSNICM